MSDPAPIQPLSSGPHRLAPARRHLVRALLAALALLAILFVVGQSQLGTLVEQVLGALRTAGPTVFFSAMAILPAVGFPLLPFALTAGPAFGPTLGLWQVALLACAAVAVNVTLSYTLARRVFGPGIFRLITRLGYRTPTLPQGSDWYVVLAIRLAPGLPFWVQSYLLGTLAVAWLPYFVISTLVPSSYLAGLIIFGGSVWQGKTGAALLGAMLAGVAVCAVALWRRMAK